MKNTTGPEKFTPTGPGESRPSEREPFDRRKLYQRIDHDQELLGEIVGIFLADYPTLLQRIRQALDNGDSTSVRRAAHTLKGSVGNLLADEAYEAARRVEETGQEGKLTEARRALSRLEAELDRLRPALRRLLSRVDSGERSDR